MPAPGPSRGGPHPQSPESGEWRHASIPQVWGLRGSRGPLGPPHLTGSAPSALGPRPQWSGQPLPRPWESPLAGRQSPPPGRPGPDPLDRLAGLATTPARNSHDLGCRCHPATSTSMLPVATSCPKTGPSGLAGQPRGQVHGGELQLPRAGITNGRQLSCHELPHCPQMATPDGHQLAQENSPLGCPVLHKALIHKWEPEAQDGKRVTPRPLTSQQGTVPVSVLAGGLGQEIVPRACVCRDSGNGTHRKQREKRSLGGGRREWAVRGHRATAGCQTLREVAKEEPQRRSCRTLKIALEERKKP